MPEMKPDAIRNGVVLLRECSRDEKAYIACGGLNVREIEDDGINICNSAGSVLEVFEALLGRAASYNIRITATSFMRVHAATAFGVRGHLFPSG
jgi:hypothetical protein